MNPSADIQRIYPLNNQQNIEPRSSDDTEDIIFRCNRLKDSDDLREILPSLVNVFPQFIEEQLLRFQRDGIVYLLPLAAAEEQLTLSLMLANWYVTNQSTETRLPSEFASNALFRQSNPNRAF